MVGRAALAPYRVVDLTTAEGWLCGKLLADLGADVVKIEPPGGDPGRRCDPCAGTTDTDPETNVEWWFANRGKRSVVLDAATAEGRAGFVDLVAGAHVVLASGGPHGLEAFGFDPGQLLDRQPGLVVTTISPFGADGPYAGHRGPDLVVAALSGLMWLTGDVDRPPVRVSAPQCHRHAAAEAAVHTLVALHHAARTGRGQVVDVAALAAMVRTTMNATDFRLLEGQELTRLGAGVAYAPGRPRQIYACADGHVTFMAAVGPLGGPTLESLRRRASADGLAVPDALRGVDLSGISLSDLDGREARQRFVEGLEDMVSGLFATRTKAELYLAAIEERMFLAPVNTVADLGDDEQLAARGYWDDVTVGDGRPVRFPGPWARLSATPLVATPRGPRVGEHTDAVLAELRLPVRRRGRPGAAGGPPGAVDGADPFAGLKVWDMSWVGVGPLTTRYLADYGATVVRLDCSRRPDVLRAGPPFAGGVPGPNRSQFYADFNASKLGIGLDLERPEARQVARRLAAWADVVVESFTPKTLQAFGLHYDELRRVNPSLVMLSTCMQGQTGPGRNYRGFGQLMASLSGFFEVTGWPDRDPTVVYGAYTDFICQRLCATALVAAVDHRRRTGEGQHLDIAQFEAALQFLGPELVDHAANGRVATRRGNRDPFRAPHGVYPCRPAGDGPAGERWLAVACEDDGQWATLVDRMGRPAWAVDPALAMLSGRKAAEDRLDASLAGWTADHDVRELAARLQPDVAAAPVLAPGDLLDDPQLRHLGYFPVVEHPVMGPVPYNGMQARLSGTPGRIRKAAPCVGEDSYRILTELLGYSEDEVADLVACEAVEITVG